MVQKGSLKPIGPRRTPALKALAERLELPATWELLPLRDPERERLMKVLDRIKHLRASPQPADPSLAGARGTTLLFAGPEANGKPITAAVLAKELGSELYRIDLAGLVSKYIGETEKNLNRLFAAAEASGAVLLFDEADALFGRRTEVKDAHDRYANLEANYLIERLTSHRGLVILATNASESAAESLGMRFDCVIEFGDPPQP